MLIDLTYSITSEHSSELNCKANRNSVKLSRTNSPTVYNKTHVSTFVFQIFNYPIQTRHENKFITNRSAKNDIITILLSKFSHFLGGF